MQYIAPPQADHTPLYDLTNRDYRPAYFVPPGRSALLRHRRQPALPAQHGRGRPLDADGRRGPSRCSRGTTTSARTRRRRRSSRSTGDFAFATTLCTAPSNAGCACATRTRVPARSSLVDRFRYGEGVPNDKTLNLRGKVWQHYDGSGLAQTDECDLAGKPLDPAAQIGECRPGRRDRLERRRGRRHPRRDGCRLR